ncbi:7605_t:CDS:1, partial [Ambispora leptoticha]
MNSDANKLRSNLKCEVHTHLLESNKNQTILQEIFLRISDKPRIQEILETFKKIEPTLETTSTIRFRFTDIVNEKIDNSTDNIKTITERFLASNYVPNHSILINNSFIDLERNNQPTFLKTASDKVYNVKDGDNVEKTSELDEIFDWDFHQ